LDLKTCGENGKMMNPGLGLGGFGMGFGLLFWIFIFRAVYYVLVEKDKTHQKESPAFEILRKNYAYGEITKDKFLYIKKEIQNVH
jgi:uncharacterized membrane protein